MQDKSQLPEDWRRQLLQVVKSWHRRADAAQDDDDTGQLIMEARNIGHWLSQWEPYVGAASMAARLLNFKRRTVQDLRPVMADLNEILAEMED